MPSKIFRDPLYNYIALDLDKGRDNWLLELLDCPEIQRLRRIHQLGVSYLTYPGADHNRLAHSLGVLHMMLQALKHLEGMSKDEQVNQARAPLLAAALAHDVGHGPFSHLYEFNPPLRPGHPKNHEVWSQRIILEDTNINRVLRGVNQYLPQFVADLIEEKNHKHPAWMKYLLSSQLDVDRLDYLRRDSLFTGAGFGHFDWFRILNTFEFHEAGGQRSIVWPEKSKLAIEEYVFARYYMYQNVYLHKTTRGFEKLIEAMWRRAKKLHDDDTDVNLLPPIRDFWATQEPTDQQYLAIEEYTVLYQIQLWTTSKDKSLNDLARRFLHRERLAVVAPPSSTGQLVPESEKWETALDELTRNGGFEPEMYCLEDTIKTKYNAPYSPEKEADEQSVKNAIRIKIDGEECPVEIVKLLPRLVSVTTESTHRVRYYVPKELQQEAFRLRANWK